MTRHSRLGVRTLVCGLNHLQTTGNRGSSPRCGTFFFPDVSLSAYSAIIIFFGHSRLGVRTLVCGLIQSANHWKPRFESSLRHRCFFVVLDVFFERKVRGCLSPANTFSRRQFFFSFWSFGHFAYLTQCLGNPLISLVYVCFIFSSFPISASAACELRTMAPSVHTIATISLDSVWLFPPISSPH